MPTRSAIGKALGYLQGQWDPSGRCPNDPGLPIDKNACERAMLTFLIGRTGCPPLFSDPGEHLFGQARIEGRPVARMSARMWFQITRVGFMLLVVGVPWLQPGELSRRQSQR